MDCKKALLESRGDFDAAIDHLRKKGQKVAAKRADREATEGVVIAKTNSNDTRGVMINLSCETDFVAKNEEFIAFAAQIAETALTHELTEKENLLSFKMNGLSIADAITEKVGKIGEKIEIKDFFTLQAGCVVSYIHANYKVGVLVGVNQASSNAIKEGAKDVAMQIAAMNPVAIDGNDVPSTIIDHEKQIGREKAISEGKPEQIVDRIAEGMVKKFLKENTLLNQQFVKDSSKTIREYLKGVDTGLQVTGFKRSSLG